MKARASIGIGLVWAACGLLGPAQGTQEAPESAPSAAGRQELQPLSREDLIASLHRAFDYLITQQNPDGSWGGRGPESELEDNFAINTYAAWRIGGHSIATMAMRATAQGDERHEAALRKAVDWLVREPLPDRDSDWDIDYIWSSVYGLQACVELLLDERFQGPDWKPQLEARGKEFLAVLAGHQALSGGWAYYDFRPYAKTPTWATSFTTAAVLPALVDARDRLGWPVQDAWIERAQRYVERCALPNGAYAYDLEEPFTSVGGLESINQIPGSLSRIQVCNWALVRLGVKRVTPEVLREGLEAFFRYHAFLDDARTRPIPHEGYFANAGYFYFFGHYYAAKVIALLPQEEQAQWYARLSPHLTKTQWKDGSTSDFLRSPYTVVAGTGFLMSGLQAELDAHERAAAATPEPDDPTPKDSAPNETPR